MVDHPLDARADNHVVVHVTQTFAVTTNGCSRQPYYDSFAVVVDERQVRWCERAVRFIDENYIRIGERYLLRVDTACTESVDAGDLAIGCAVWVFPGHDDAVINTELLQLVRTLVHKLASMGQKLSTTKFLRCKFYDLGSDDCLAPTSGNDDENLAVARPDRLSHLLDNVVLPVPRSDLTHES